MEFIDKNTIKLDRTITELDKFVLEFVKILEKYADYVIISGYVAILFGRARATEDVDVFIERIDEDKLTAFYEELKGNGYWCLNAEYSEEVYGYLKDNLAVRFAIKDETVPNVEVKFTKKQLDEEALKDRIIVIVGENRLNVSSIERQIAFKKYYLKSDKDLEDARHIENLFKDHLDYGKIEEYKRLIENGET
jgi:hypothetical protein